MGAAAQPRIRTAAQSLKFDLCLAMLPNKPWVKVKAIHTYHAYLLSHQRSNYGGGSEMHQFDTPEAFVQMCIDFYGEVPAYILEKLSE